MARVTLGHVGRPVKALLEAHKNSTTDLRTAQRRVAEDVENWLTTKAVGADKISIAEAFEALVLESNPQIDLRYSSLGEIREAMVSSSFPVITQAMINSTFMTEYELATDAIMHLVTERESKRPVETYAGTTPGQRGGYTEEGAPFSEIQIGEKYITIPNFKFGKGVSMTREMVLFDQTGKLVERARANGEYLGNLISTFLCYRLTDTVWPEVDISGTSQAFVINGTRRAMYASTHASWDAYANDNLVDAALPTIPVVKGMRQLALQMKDEQGEEIVTRPKYVFGHELMGDDLEQFFHAQEFEINSAEKNRNIYRNTVGIVTSPFFPSTTNWFYGDPAKQFILQWVWKPRTVADELGDPRRDIIGSWWSSAMLGIGAEDYRYVIKNAYGD